MRNAWHLVQREPWLARLAPRLTLQKRIPQRLYFLEKRDETNGAWNDMMQAGPFTGPLSHRFSINAAAPRASLRIRIESAP